MFYGFYLMTAFEQCFKIFGSSSGTTICYAQYILCSLTSAIYFYGEKLLIDKLYKNQFNNSILREYTESNVSQIFKIKKIIKCFIKQTLSSYLNLFKFNPSYRCFNPIMISQQHQAMQFHGDDWFFYYFCLAFSFEILKN